MSSSISNHNSERHTSVNDYHRLSNTDSGILSIRSSYSKRSSQQSSISSQFTHHMSKHASNMSEMMQAEGLLQNLQRGFEGQVTFKNFSHSSTSSSSVVMVSNASLSRDELDFLNEEVPPAIPQKTKRKTDRQPSPYDNVPDEKLGRYRACGLTNTESATSTPFPLLVRPRR